MAVVFLCSNIMITTPYALTAGNAELLVIQATGGDMLFQVWYTNVVSTTVKIEVWISTESAGPFAKIPDVEKTIVGADNTAFIAISGAGYGFLQFKVVAAGGTAGSITKVRTIY